jgi:hypothetical protein
LDKRQFWQLGTRNSFSFTRGSRLAAAATLALLGFGACAGEADEEPAAGASPHSERAGLGLSETQQALGPGVSIDPRRSLAVTDQVILDQFSPPVVLSAIIASAGATGSITVDQLFRQLWDTQNPTPGQSDLPNNAHCSDNGGTLNGFPYPCRTFEGAQAAPAPPALQNYRAIGLFNRFDLAPTNGANCGEYRVVFAKIGGGGGRNFVIFEAVLPNPQPSLGLEGCRPVANFWRDLSTAPTLASRITSLQTFYFTGLPGFSPVFHINNYGAGSTGEGQVRTNQFIQPLWLLREFQMRRVCPPTGCIAKFIPVTVKVNPGGTLFSSSSTHPQAAAFKTQFISQVAALAVNNINTFNHDVPDVFNIGQSDAQSGGATDNYVAQLGAGPSPFRTAIQAQLTSIGSALTPDQIVARAQALSCGGCHQRSNGANLGGGLVWPSSAGFVHNSESTEAGPDGPRFILSPALVNVFLPHRKAVLETFLNKLRTVSSGQQALTAVAALRGNAYFAENTNPGTVSKVAPGGLVTSLATGRFNLTGVAADNFNVYWLENGNPGSVQKVSINGGGSTVLASNRPALKAIATDGSSVFWLENTAPGSIRKVPVLGGAITQVASNLPAASALAVDSTSLYWLEGTSLRKMPKAGGPIITLSNGVIAQALATDGVRLFFTDNAAGTIRTMPVAGGGTSLLHAGAPSLTATAVDATSVYWTENTGPGRVKTGPK